MHSILEILEWPKVLEHLESCCKTGYGRLLIQDDDVLWLPDADAMERSMRQVDEAKRMVQRYGDPQVNENAIEDITPTLDRLEKGGQVPSTRLLGMLLSTLIQLRQIGRFFITNRSKTDFPELAEILTEITLPSPVIERLEQIVSEDGDLKESASLTYAAVKRRLADQKSRLHEHMQGLIHGYPFSKYLQEPIFTERDGRYVVPVKAEHKVDVRGIVHGSSSTGSTFFIEPQSVVDQNNRLAESRSELEREIHRILIEVSQAMAPEVPALRLFLDQMARLDLLLAKALQSLELDGNPVSIDPTPGRIHLRYARHPLLMLQPDPVVPNDIILDPPHQVMLITGPNTGGKTVLLKLVGLCALMLRAGMHLPVREGSHISMFTPVLADIGDPQSIAQNLSTFSGHIGRIKSFLDEPDLSQALILIDEICAGTDPQAGAVLAEAVLERFYERGATTIVTTHIGALKVVAHDHAGYLNASVEFDVETLSPTYRLILGIPGTSNALNIAQRLGIPQDIIGRAKAKLSQAGSDAAALLEALESKNLQLTQELEQAKKLREDIAWEEAQMSTQLNRIEGEKKRTVQMFKDSLKDKLRFIEREVDELRKELRDSKRWDEDKIADMSRQFRRLQGDANTVFNDETEKLFPKPNIRWEDIAVGDIVESRSLNLSGQVLEKNDGKQELILQAGILRTTLPFSDIIRKLGTPPKDKRMPAKKARLVTERPKMRISECDVRGMTAEDAIGVLEKFLDDALITDMHEVGVIHGQGTGALKKAIRSYLKELPYIKTFHPAPAIDGGDGKTIIELS